MEEKASSNTPTTINDKHLTESASVGIDAECEDGEIEDDHAEVKVSTAAAEGDDAAFYENEDAAAGPTVTDTNARTEDGGPMASLKGIIQFQSTLTSILKIYADSNQVLENIKMAYWWAGYYSGLYEGQQQARDNTTTAQH